jgi:hypothetical protein
MSAGAPLPVGEKAFFSPTSPRHHRLRPAPPPRDRAPPGRGSLPRKDEGGSGGKNAFFPPEATR